LFLGVGARKLTENSSEFEAALKRCNRPNRPVRFLLCKPTSTLLSRAAQSAGEAVNAYEHRVLESLKVIAMLRKNRDWNIEVRFYQIERPLFRLMFIDSWLCWQAIMSSAKEMDQIGRSCRSGGTKRNVM
jgi:hypothetical protein